MGYPMTFQRLLKRNQLSDGGYGTRMSAVNVDQPGALSVDEFHQVMAPHWRVELQLLDDRWGMLLGDLRRLEHDATDEGATCAHVASRTGIDPEVVAAVLKEFLAW